MPGPNCTNAERVERARIALDAYRNIRGADPDALMRDLLADMMHLAAEEEMDFSHELEMARDHYEAESRGED
jgi:hypothetical protein